MEFSLGLDFGTSAARAILLNIQTGEMMASGSSTYEGGNNGIFTDAQQPLLARQSPTAYMNALERATKIAMAQFTEKGLDLTSIVGIGVDATGSTPIPVKQNLQPLEALPEFKENLNAYAWLWKDHTAVEEALAITQKAAELRPEYLAKCGGTYSSEWFWSKIWHCLNADPTVFGAADSWLEQSDFIPATLSGIADVSQVKRNICAAGHKAMYADAWDGLPDKEFLGALDPKLADLRDRLYNRAYAFEEIMGYLSAEWAERLDLPQGIPIAVGALDAHVGAIGAGVGQGKFVKIIGTSTCDIMAFPMEQAPKDFYGVAGIVEGSVLPGHIGIEAGQAAVGDLLNWWVQQVLGKDSGYHAVLTEQASALKAGESGLLALDWNNGNRNILGDQQLSGLILGQTLATKDYEIYRTLIEATAFGALKIIKLVEAQGVEINEVIATGGIGHKNELFMQLYADILGCTLKLVDNPETVAVGAAIMGAVAAKKGGEGFESIEKVLDRLSVAASKSYEPNKGSHQVYQKLFCLYSTLHDAFGYDQEANLYVVMKELTQLKIASNKN